MRPLSGESLLEFVERSGNYLPSVCLIFLRTASRTEALQWISVCGAFFLAGFSVCLFLRVFNVFPVRSIRKNL